ncbi:alpha/beta hydrolase fold domain-containing protein [Sulfitobacter sp. D35]|uniref:alpha/beta hydrolase fold domain-containing protein n=1 Tax=Sulfitobacter sp. D35 TaxID=3083252 RepID=UPI00296F69A0|nr:alpha/beta hydrolase fold domain-containing protein [Sulfitobacter sp. D35]MDW4498370.1 alpha/beta hydrolase fold domain-containing protein [Sulfitobacter sp. D35]
MVLAISPMSFASLSWAEESSPWKLGERELPPPAHVSPELRAILENTPQPDVDAAIARRPETLEEWRAFAAESDATGAALVSKVSEVAHIDVAEDEVAGVTVYRLTPPEIAPEYRERLFVHVHGGAFVKNSGLAATSEGLLIAHFLKMRVVSIDYRMPPDHPAPATIEDVVAVWQALVSDHSSDSMALGGTSAGANLTLAATLPLKERGIALPGALMVGTPAADLSEVNDTKFLNEGVDRMLVSWSGYGAGGVELCVGDMDIKDPRVSPIFGDFTGFPPAYLITGTRDMLLSDTALVHRKLRRAGVIADLHFYEGLSHADYLTACPAPEVAEHHAELDRFLKEHLN